MLLCFSMFTGNPNHLLTYFWSKWSGFDKLYLTPLYFSFYHVLFSPQFPQPSIWFLLLPSYISNCCCYCLISPSHHFYSQYFHKCLMWHLWLSTISHYSLAYLMSFSYIIKNVFFSVLLKCHSCDLWTKCHSLFQSGRYQTSIVFLRYFEVCAHPN